MNSDTFWRWAGWIIGASLAGYWAYSSWIVQPEKSRQRNAERQAASSQRFTEWAHISREKEISAGETIKLVVIPHPSGVDFLDTKCLIYTHKEFRTSTMLCPDAKQEDIGERPWSAYSDESRTQ